MVVAESCGSVSEALPLLKAGVGGSGWEMHLHVALVWQSNCVGGWEEMEVHGWNPSAFRGLMSLWLC